MRKKIVMCSVMGLLAGTGLSVPHGVQAQPAFRGSQVRTLPIAAALSNKDRPEADRARDRTRKPAELLAFAGMGPGMKVADIMPGQGYFTRIFSNVVGKTGHVYALVAAERVAEKPSAADAVKAIAAEPAFSNVSVLAESMLALSLPEPVDMAWTSQNYHDVYGRGVEAALAFDRSVFNILRPGGVYMVIDHVAAAGSTEDTAKTLHRIDPALIRSQVEKAGFVFESESSALRNAQDTHAASVFDETIKGHTDQVVYKFRKPAR
ncbi:class I SAM-dependent methyltransferase [Acetobacter sp.]|uniref:class I SAM-dependent methyltransferase n=1 Tax=Acetobacter sp. TaxID=440 RepID=UPI0025BFB1C6|nr:methyltransferase [Acetobacter sp.]MCH4090681.1 methyltransferase [Acetobacter sp.]MCI1300124.1 methyltransferase [Acetobacter sp.]MCI1316542.1 methyltransferase [Acetobacter sp.]